jgi:hypothetical protein
MRAHLYLTAASITAALLLASTAAAVGQQPPAPQEQTQPQGVKEHLSNDANVQQSQEPQPGAQGIRSPKAETSGTTQASTLQEALKAFYRAPPDLLGSPQRRPNQWASNPDDPNEPTRSQNPSDLSSQDIK